LVARTKKAEEEELQWTEQHRHRERENWRQFLKENERGIQAHEKEEEEEEEVGGK
jgi:hypothetical protein